MIKVVIAQNEKEAREISVRTEKQPSGHCCLELSASRFGGYC